jgi:hypothetical protein
MIESGPIPVVHGVVRSRLIDLAQRIFEEFRPGAGGRLVCFSRSLILSSPAFCTPRRQRRIKGRAGAPAARLEIGGRVRHDLPLEETTDPSEFICVQASKNHIVLRLERHDEIVVIPPDRYSSPDSIVGGIIGYCWHAAPMSKDQ